MIGIRVSQDFRKLLEELAEKENRTLSGYIKNVLIGHIKENENIDWRKIKKKK